MNASRRRSWSPMQHSSSFSQLCVVFTGALVSGCSSPFTNGDCTLIVRPAVTVEIRDTESGRPLADSASGVIRNGLYVDSLKPFRADSAGRLVALQAYGSAGIYRVEIRRPGYQDWVSENVRVTENHCGDNTVALSATLIAAVPR